MAFQHRIKKASEHFGINTPEDWRNIKPEWIQAIDGVGPKTLDTIRIYLAMRGLTLRDDATVEFWMKNLQTAEIGGQLSLVDNQTTEAFTILIDSQEKQPWAFQGFLDANERPIIQPVKWQTLGPTRADYSVAGCEGWVHIERKSVADALGTFLSHGERRERWIRTMEFLAEIPYGHIVIEGTYGTCLGSITQRGKRTTRALLQEFDGSVMSWSDRYGVPFWFMDSPRLAEKKAQRILKRGWRKANEQSEQLSSVDVDVATARL
jgi:hypothetical protein